MKDGPKDTTKDDRKRASAAARVRGNTGKRGGYEETPFGRRRISKVPKPLATLLWLAGIPVLFIYRRLHNRKPQ
jgi:hypothetical protein